MRDRKIIMSSLKPVHELRSMYHFQSKLMFRGLGFRLGFTVYLLICTGFFIRTMLAMKTRETANSIDPMFAYILHIDNAHLYFVYLIPILSIFPFSASYAKDKRLSYSTCVFSRGSIRDYYLVKALLCLEGGFLILFIPLLINIVLNFLFLYNTGLNPSGQPLGHILFYGHLNPNYQFYSHESLSLYLEHPMLYCTLFAALASVYSGICSLFAYSVSFFLHKYGYLICVPLLLVTIASETICDQYYASPGYTEVGIHSYIFIGSSRFKNYMVFFIYLILLAAASVCIIHRQIRKEQL